MTKYDICQGLDGDYYFLGEHLSLEDAITQWNIYDGDDSKYAVESVEHTYCRHGFLPEGMDEPGTRGWWIVDKKARGTAKVTIINIIRLKKAFGGGR